MVAPLIPEKGKASYVTLDGIDYPLVPGSEVLANPLNPFSPNSQAGNSQRVVSTRHASRVWDDFTTGIGFEDDNEEHGGIAYGNLDIRTPAQTTLPPRTVPKDTTSGFNSNAYLPVRVQYMANHNDGTFTFFAYGNNMTTGQGIIRTFRGSTRTTYALTSVNEIILGVAQGPDAYWYFSTWDTVANSSRLYRITNINHLNGVITFSLVLTTAATKQIGLIGYDGQLITYNETTNLFQQLNTVGPAWATYLSGIPKAPYLESAKQLFVWTDRSGSRDAIYMLTNARILVYDDEGEQWEPFYEFGKLWPASNGFCHVNVRDNTLLFVPTHDPNTTYNLGGLINDNILAFSPGTVDSWAVNKNRGLPSEIAYTAGTGHIASVCSGMASNSKGLFAFFYVPTAVGSVTGIGSTVMFRNANGGWSIVFDSGSCDRFGNPYSPILGGAVGANRLFILLQNGYHYELDIADADINHPNNSYEDTRAYFIQSGRIYNNQRNLTKLGSHAELKFKTALTANHNVLFKWRTFDGTTLSGWSSSSNLAVGTPIMATINFGDTPYIYFEWRVEMTNLTSFVTPPILESVTLYYTFWQQNHYAYSFTIDLSVETWQEMSPTGLFHGKSRQVLQEQLLSTIDQKKYHIFSYNRFGMFEFIQKADILVSRRESADNGGGVYPTTVRDLEA